MNRPDWKAIYAGTARAPDESDDDLLEITRETLRLARAALRTLNATDYYHNNGAAERELIDVLGK